MEKADLLRHPVEPADQVSQDAIDAGLIAMQLLMLVGGNPEHLLLAAVAACFMFTFRAVARGSKFDFLSLDLPGSGTVDRKDGTTRFTEIVLRPRLTLPKGADPERANRVLEKGETACPVTASLSVPVRVEAEILAEA
jgi:organic hydroperoxide reductase OsmC/OhrA